jgi:hypothetical protein
MIEMTEMIEDASMRRLWHNYPTTTMYVLTSSIVLVVIGATQGVL